MLPTIDCLRLANVFFEPSFIDIEGAQNSPNAVKIFIHFDSENAIALKPAERGDLSIDDPITIFNSLTRSKEMEDLWPAQEEVLTKYYKLLAQVRA